MARHTWYLIVSRNQPVQDLCVTLRAQRLRAIGVATCQEAVRLAALTHVAAILFDVEGLDDWHSLERLHGALSHRIPIVVLSGEFVRDRTDRNLARYLGCAGFVAKPATSALVCRALQRAADGSPWSEYIDRCE